MKLVVLNEEWLDAQIRFLKHNWYKDGKIREDVTHRIAIFEMIKEEATSILPHIEAALEAGATICDKNHDCHNCFRDEISELEEINLYKETYK